MREHEFHPLAADYPLMPADDLGYIEQTMRNGGYDPRFPIVLYEGKILDGRNRYKAAVAAKIEAEFIDFLGTEDEAKQFVETANANRRHLAKEWLAKHRQERIARVAAARAEGKSTRVIAEEEGISQPQVLRDLTSGDTSPVSPDPDQSDNDSDDSLPGEWLDMPEPEPAKVVGKDGKTYDATKPVILCERCQRTGPVKGCSMCADARRVGPKQKRVPKPDASAVDAFGNPLPARCRHAYQDPWIQQTIDFLAVASANFWGERMIEGMDRRSKHFPFFIPKDFIDGVGFAGNYIDQLLDHLKQNRPAGVCPSCDGKGCSDCRLCGMVPRTLYETLKEKTK